MNATKMATWTTTMPAETADRAVTCGPRGSKASAPGTGGRIASRPNSMIADSTTPTVGANTRKVDRQRWHLTPQAARGSDDQEERPRPRG